MDIKDIMSSAFAVSLIKKLQKQFDNSLTESIDDVRYQHSNVQLTPGPKGDNTKYKL